MTEEEKQVYGGAYDAPIREAYRAVTEREPFRYRLDGDALYKQYRDRYVENARRAMQDTMGQAASLTGGYGSSYAQGAGQQAYDETLRGLTDRIPELEDRAYQHWKDQGDTLYQTYQMLTELGAADQATRRDDAAQALAERQYADRLAQYADEQRQQAYSNLSAAILKSGYAPDEDELSAAGMSRAQAEALRQAWMAANPNLAYQQGALNADAYSRLTGKAAPGSVTAAVSGGWNGGGGGGGSKKKTAADTLKAAAQAMQRRGASSAEVNSFLLHNYEAYGASASDVRSIRSEIGTTGR